VPESGDKGIFALLTADLCGLGRTRCNRISCGIPIASV